MPRILIVDDDMFFRTVITKLLTGHGYDITSVQSGEKALDLLKTKTFDLMISDVNMAPMDGMELLQKAQESYAHMGVIMLTGHDEIEIAIEAMKKGAFDFLVKPFQLNDLFLTVQRSLGYYNASPANKPLQTRLDMLEGLVTESDSMRKICEVIRRVAPANVTVLLCGESGSDYELIARTIHYYSPRKDGLFMTLDCAATPAQLIESKLFGDHTFNKGLFETAHGGTLFLDNIDAIPIQIQPKLLNVIQKEEIRRVDGSTHTKIDVRIVVASRERLDHLVEQKAFHENLYYRLSALRLDIPPLRNRPEDIPCLIDQAIRRTIKSDTETLHLDPMAKEILCNYPWPGNIRELEDVIQQVCSFAQNGLITKAMLPEKIVTIFDAGIRNQIVTNHRAQLKGQSFKAFLHSKHGELLSRINNPLNKDK
jgi:DNA-binding NtrC family response regulator